MTDGFAIPHAQSAAIKQSSMLILKLKNPIEWDSLDGQKIDTVISFLVPEKDSKKHLQYLSNTAKLLTHQDFIEKLKKLRHQKKLKIYLLTTKNKTARNSSFILCLIID